MNNGFWGCWAPGRWLPSAFLEVSKDRPAKEHHSPTLLHVNAQVTCSLTSPAAPTEWTAMDMFLDFKLKHAVL